MNERILKLLGDSQFERDLYEAAMFNLEDRRNKLRFHNFAFAMRELVGHTLARLAPDENVQKCIWWKAKSKEVVHQVTRVERCVYATQGGLSNHYVERRLGLDFNPEHENLRDAVIRLNEYVHITPEVFQLKDDDIDRLSGETIEAVAGLMGCIQECRAAVAERLSDVIISEAAVNQVVSDSLDAVDELATHYSLEEVYVDSHEVSHITCDAVHIKVSGTVGVTLQWGSNSDLRNGDGAELDQSFDFTCELTCETPNPDPEKLEFVENSVMVDTGDWYDRKDEWDYALESDVSADQQPLSAENIQSDF
ncbi:hypothetical protein SAMN02745900_03580 [Pseudomonas sp. URIL14HWK12:I8]|uniref:pPIWI-associating nuclease domain-containing protein n=1 Tax=unclassified Pseudomonas TaxID=196821 RepID=UPI000404F57A|nr:MULTISPECIES: hypothetical protein [unclassified Pseudomonas]SNB79906.1 hypothetical protein SAMN02745900_03580 [Pseudomonas sp. URIL14HWK12:I8]